LAVEVDSDGNFITRGFS